MKTIRIVPVALLALATCMLPLSSSLAQGTAFSYQGMLTVNGAPASGLFDLRFELFETLTGGGSRFAPFETNSVRASNGLFVTQIDFGLLVDKTYWLELGVRP